MLEVENQFAEINIYDLYRKCWHPSESSQLKGLNSKGEEYKIGATAQDYTPWLFPEHNKRGLKIADNDSPPCVYFKGTTTFFNEDTVKRKLHA